MTPADRYLQTNVSARRRFALADAVSEHAGVVEPFLAKPEPRQRRARQHIEAATACPAHAALESGGRTCGFESLASQRPQAGAPRKPRLD